MEYTEKEKLFNKKIEAETETETETDTETETENIRYQNFINKYERYLTSKIFCFSLSITILFLIIALVIILLYTCSKKIETTVVKE